MLRERISGGGVVAGFRAMVAGGVFLALVAVPGYSLVGQVGPGPETVDGPAVGEVATGVEMADAGVEMADPGVAEPGEAVGGLAGLEWRGVTVLDGKAEFSLRDTGSQTSFWVGLGETENGVEAVEYSEEEGKLVVSDGRESRELFLSGGTVAALPEGRTPSAEPPPLVETPGLIAERARLNPESLPEEISEEARRVSELWQNAVQAEPRLREMDDRFREIRLESERIEQAMTRVPEDAPEFRALETRREQIGEEEELLTQAALVEVRASPELREQAGNELGDALREQIFGGPPQPRAVAEPVAPVVEEPVAEDVEETGAEEPVVVEEPVEEVGEPNGSPPQLPPVTDLDLEPPPPPEEAVLEREM